KKDHQHPDKKPQDHEKRIRKLVDGIRPRIREQMLCQSQSADGEERTDDDAQAGADSSDLGGTGGNQRLGLLAPPAGKNVAAELYSGKRSKADRSWNGTGHGRFS